MYLIAEDARCWKPHCSWSQAQGCCCISARPLFSESNNWTPRITRFCGGLRRAGSVVQFSGWPVSQQSGFAGLRPSWRAVPKSACVQSLRPLRYSPDAYMDRVGSIVNIT